MCHSPCLSPVSTQILMSALESCSMVWGTPSCSLSSTAEAPKSCTHTHTHTHTHKHAHTHTRTHTLTVYQKASQWAVGTETIHCVCVCVCVEEIPVRKLLLTPGLMGIQLTFSVCVCGGVVCVCVSSKLKHGTRGELCV